MGFIKAFTGAISSTFADQWKDYYMPMSGMPLTAAVFPAVQVSQNNGRGENTKGNANIITNGSKILVPENTALITLQDGQITGVICEAGGYTFTSEDAQSSSIFAGNFGALFKGAWEKVMFGGMPASQQLAVYVNLKEIPGNRFGTPGKIRFLDAILGAQVSIGARGNFSIKVADPVAFIRSVGNEYLDGSGKVLDFQDIDDTFVSARLDEFTGSLRSGLIAYTSDTTKQTSIMSLQSDTDNLTKVLAKTVEDEKEWLVRFGLEITKVQFEDVDYDEATAALADRVAEADAFSAGGRGNTFAQMEIAKGIRAAGENGGGANMAFMGMGVNAAGGVMGGIQQPVNGVSPAQAAINAAGQPAAAPAQGGADKLIEMKKLLDAGVISQEEFDAAKKEFLGN